MKMNETMKNRIEKGANKMRKNENTEIVNAVITVGELFYKVKVVKLNMENICTIQRLDEKKATPPVVCYTNKLNNIYENAWKIEKAGIPKIDAMFIAYAIEKKTSGGQRASIEDLLNAIDEYESEYCAALDELNDEESETDITEDDLDDLDEIIDELYDEVDDLVDVMRNLRNELIRR